MTSGSEIKSGGGDLFFSTIGASQFTISTFTIHVQILKWSFNLPELIFIEQVSVRNILHIRWNIFQIWNLTSFIWLQIFTVVWSSISVHRIIACANWWCDDDGMSHQTGRMKTEPQWMDYQSEDFLNTATWSNIASSPETIYFNPSHYVLEHVLCCHFCTSIWISAF